MSNGSIWHRTLVYFGLAEDDTMYDDMTGGYDEPAAKPSRGASVRRIDRRRSSAATLDEADDLFAEEETSPGRRRRPAAGASSSAETSVLRSAPSASRSASAVRVHVIAPRSYNDAQQIADRFKNGVPVIMNLQTSEPDLSKRLIDFASGMTYALDGAIQRIAEKVFLLTPANVEVSAEDRQRLVDQGFFNPTA